MGNIVGDKQSKQEQGGKSSELYYNAPRVHPANKQPYNTTPIKREDADTKVYTLNHLLYYSAT